VKCR
jgi:hypothetical protein